MGLYLQKMPEREDKHVCVSLFVKSSMTPEVIIFSSARANTLEEKTDLHVCLVEIYARESQITCSQTNKLFTCSKYS